jgi:hypothetical protein
MLHKSEQATRCRCVRQSMCEYSIKVCATQGARSTALVQIASVKTYQGLTNSPMPFAIGGDIHPAYASTKEVGRKHSRGQSLGST